MHFSCLSYADVSLNSDDCCFQVFLVPHAMPIRPIKDIRSTDNGKHAAWVVPLDLYTL